MFTNIVDNWFHIPEERKTLNMKVRRNSQGFKDYEFSLEKPDNTFRIIALGDSFTEGQWVDVNDTWPKQLEKKLNELNSSYQFQVFNFGVGGSCTLEELKLFKEKAIRYSPDMIILGFYGNDWEDCKWIRKRQNELQEAYANGSLVLPDEIREKFKEATNEEDVSSILFAVPLSEYWDAAKEKGMLKVWETNVKEPLIHLINLCKQNNISLIVVSFDLFYIDSVHEKQLLQDILGDYDVPFLDLTDVLRSYPESKIRFVDKHLNEYGYTIVSDKILEFLLQTYDWERE